MLPICQKQLCVFFSSIDILLQIPDSTGNTSNQDRNILMGSITVVLNKRLSNIYISWTWLTSHTTSRSNTTQSRFCTSASSHWALCNLHEPSLALLSHHAAVQPAIKLPHCLLSAVLCSQRWRCFMVTFHVCD